MSGILCKHCGKPPEESTKFFLCSNCRSVHYCSAACQRADWKAAHKDDCKVLAARGEEIGAGYQDVKKWIDRNRGQFMSLVWKLLDADSDIESMRSSHVVVLEASYASDKRAVDIKKWFVAAIDEFDDRRHPMQPQLMIESDWKSPREMLKTPYPNSSGELFSILVVEMTMPTGTMLRMVPLGCEPSIAEFISQWRKLERANPTNMPVEYLVDCINTGRDGCGSCGSKADKVSALAMAAEIAKDADETAFSNMRFSTIRTCLAADITELMMFTLLLGNKKLTLRKTHRMRLTLRNDPGSNESVVHQCEAVSIETLVEGARKYKPIVQCESRAGSEWHDSWEDTLRGTTEELLREAKARKSVYLPIIVEEFSRESRQYFLPSFLANVEIKKAEAYNLSQKQHEELLAKKMEALPRIPYQRKSS